MARDTVDPLTESIACAEADPEKTALIMLVPAAIAVTCPSVPGMLPTVATSGLEDVQTASKVTS